MRPLANLLAAQSILLCQSGRQGANHFRLSEYKSSNTEKLSDFSPHKIVIHSRKMLNSTMDPLASASGAPSKCPRGFVNRSALRVW
jgi:hypothetical protein